VGAELTSQNALTKWWDLSTNVNLYHSVIHTDSVGWLNWLYGAGLEAEFQYAAG